MRNRLKLTYEERYLLGYMEGYRIGLIQATRKMLIRCLSLKAKEQGFSSFRGILKKINREVDTGFLHDIFLMRLFYLKQCH